MNHGQSAGLVLAGLGCADSRESADVRTDPGTHSGKHALALPPRLMAGLDPRQLGDPRQLALPAMPSMMSVCFSSRFSEEAKQKTTASTSWTPSGGAWSLLNFGFSSTSLLTGLHLLSPSPRAPSGTLFPAFPFLFLFFISPLTGKHRLYPFPRASLIMFFVLAPPYSLNTPH